ncbi:MAG TPA: biotin synthase, partial [Pusillimonas sp.]|nr:biotin synthase [Pusillimonas sp.]
MLALVETLADDSLEHATEKWTIKRILALYELPFPELMFQAQTVHREHHNPNSVQLSSLLSIKTGGCPEDCSYCPQSARYDTGVEKEALLPIEEVLEAAKQAKAGGAQRFCMGAAWRSPKPHQIEAVAQMIREVKALGLETCVTLG